MGEPTNLTCPFCKEAVKPGATVCPHCQQPIGRHRELRKILVGGAFGGLVAVGALWLYVRADNAEVQKREREIHEAGEQERQRIEKEYDEKIRKLDGR